MNWDVLESHILGLTAPDVAIRIEEHLLVCEQCRQTYVEVESYLDLLRRGLVKVQGIFERHSTPGGIVVLRAYEDEGKWVARLQGSDLDIGSTAPNRGEAVRQCRESFAQMFPEHRCGPGCQAF